MCDQNGTIVLVVLMLRGTGRIPVSSDQSRSTRIAFQKRDTSPHFQNKYKFWGLYLESNVVMNEAKIRPMKMGFGSYEASKSGVDLTLPRVNW